MSAADVAAAKARMKHLATKAQNIIESKSFSTTDKRLELDKLDVDLKAAMDIVTMHEQAQRLIGGGGSGSADEFGDAGDGVHRKGMTRIPLDMDQSRALFKAAQDRQGITIKTSEFVGTGNLDPALYPAQLLPPVLAAREPTRILDAMPSSGTGSGVVEYYVTTGTMAAAAVAEGDAKPISTMSMTKTTGHMTKIAHVVEVTEEAVSDFQPFLGLLQNDMYYGLIDAENHELLNASGTAPHMFKGMLQVSGTQTYTQGTQTAGESTLDAISVAATALRVSGRFVVPDGIIMHPNDFDLARRIKATTGQYVGGVNVFGVDAPIAQTIGGSGKPNLWGIPVVLTSEITQGTAIVGNLERATAVWVREAPSFRIDPYSQSKNNIINVICEERLCLGVVAPSALSIVTFNSPV